MRPITSGTMPGVKPPTMRLDTISAAGAYGLSYLFAQSGSNYALLFVIGAAGVAAALAIELVSVLVLGRKPS